MTDQNFDGIVPTDAVELLLHSVHTPEGFEERCDEAVRAGIAIAKMRRTEHEFDQIPFDRFLEAVAFQAGVELAPVLTSLGFPEGRFTAASTFARPVARLARLLALPLETALRMVDFAFQDLRDPFAGAAREQVYRGGKAVPPEEHFREWERRANDEIRRELSEIRRAIQAEFASE